MKESNGFDIRLQGFDKYTTEDEIRRMIIGFTNPKEIIQIYLDRHKKHNRVLGRGYIKLKTEKALKEVLKLNGVEVRGRPVKFEIARTKDLDKRNYGDTSHIKPIFSERDKLTLCVKNIDRSVKRNQLYEFFVDKISRGGVRTVRFPLKNGLSRGFGFVEFTSQKALEEGKKLDGCEFVGKKLVIEPCYTTNRTYEATYESEEREYKDYQNYQPSPKRLKRSFSESNEGTSSNNFNAAVGQLPQPPDLDGSIKVKIEQPDSDYEDHSVSENIRDETSKQRNNKFNSIAMTPLNSSFYLEPGEVKIKTEPGLDVEIKKEPISSDDDSDSEKRDFPACFLDLETCSIENVKKLICKVLQPSEVADLFLVSEEKRKFAILKLTTKKALKEILKFNEWAVDGGIVRIKEIDLIRLKIDPTVSNNLNLVSPSERLKTKSTEGEVKNPVKKEKDEQFCINIDESEDDNNEGKTSQRRYRVFFGNINNSTTNHQIKSFLESVVAPDQITRLHRPNDIKSVFFVDLASQESLNKVLTLNGSILMDRPVRIGYSLRTT